jgi:hypothetical protein
MLGAGVECRRTVVPTAGKPIVLITVFGTPVLQRILNEIAAGPTPPIADWFIGTFGVNKAAAELVAGTTGCNYAPVFGIQPRTSRMTRQRRRVPKDDTLRIGDAAHAGEIPGSSDEKVIPPGDRRAWGIELGCRFRDEMRTARANGIPIETWQFDEILGQCRLPGSSNPHREFVGGVLRGLADGRRQLGDTPEKGFVWSARTAVVGLPSLPLTGDVPAFWQDIDRAARSLVGEEYQEFKGNPAVIGRRFSDGHQALVRSTGVRRSLGERYVVGMTPGWRPPSSGLGGNVEGRPPKDVTSWRNGFIEARIAAQRPQGFAQFNFVLENVRPNRLEDAVRSLHHACRQHSL